MNDFWWVLPMLGGCVGLAIVVTYPLGKVFEEPPRRKTLVVGLALSTLLYPAFKMSSRSGEIYRQQQVEIKAQYDSAMKSRGCFVADYTSERHRTYEIWQCPKGRVLGWVVR